MGKIQNISSEIQGVLYQFNKIKMDNFFSHQENLLLFRYFLKICETFFKSRNRENLVDSILATPLTKGAKRDREEADSEPAQKATSAS